MENQVINEVYFHELNKDSVEKGYINNQKAIMNAEISFDATVGSTVKTIENIMELKVEDIIVLGKKSDELIDVRINGVKCAMGETLFVDGKLGVRLLEF